MGYLWTDTNTAEPWKLKHAFVSVCFLDCKKRLHGRKLCVCVYSVVSAVELPAPSPELGLLQTRILALILDLVSFQYYTNFFNCKLNCQLETVADSKGELKLSCCSSLRHSKLLYKTNLWNM